MHHWGLYPCWVVSGVVAPLVVVMSMVVMTIVVAMMVCACVYVYTCHLKVQLDATHVDRASFVHQLVPTAHRLAV